MKILLIKNCWSAYDHNCYLARVNSSSLPIELKDAFHIQLLISILLDPTANQTSRQNAIEILRLVKDTDLKANLARSFTTEGRELITRLRSVVGMTQSEA